MTQYRTELLSDQNRKAWADFCLACDNAWYWHTTGFQQFTIDSHAPGARNHSFLVYDNDELVAVVPLIICAIERITGYPVHEIAFSGWSNPYPAVKSGLGEAKTFELTNFIFERISALAERERVARAAFSIFYQQKEFFRQCLKYNIMLSQPGFLDVSEYAQVIDLSGELDEIENGFRKRFMRYIRANKENIATEIITAANLSPLHSEECLALAEKDVSQEWPAVKMPYINGSIAAGQGILIRCYEKKENQPVGALFVITYKGYAYDFAVAVDDAFKEMRVSHAMKLAAVRHLKDHNFKSYELGIATFRSSLHRIASEKRRAISYFKSGFANGLIPMFIAEKFYDRQYLLATMRQRVALLEKELFIERQKEAEVVLEGKR